MVYVGTPGSDSLHGTAGDDLIDALGGDDSLSGGDGNDTLLGGDGNDFLQGGSGNDFLDGGSGFYDTAYYGEATGGVQVNLATGIVTGAAGNDTIVGVEYVTGSAFADVIIGDFGNNVLQGRGGNDVLDGGGGYDLVDYAQATGGVFVNLQAGTASGADGSDTLSNFESIGGSLFDDVLIGDAGNNSIIDFAGNDSVDAGGGDDFIQAGAGNDILDGGANGVFGDNVSYFGSLGGVTVNLATGQASDGMGGSDTLVRIEHVEGSSFGDILIGDGQTNWFRPLGGDDFVDGAGGVDVVMYEGAAAGVTINLQAGTASGAAIGNDTLVSIEAAHGTSFDDHITLSHSNGYTFGRAGNDVLLGATGFDNLIGGTGNDFMNGGTGRDSVSYFDDGFDGPGGHGVVVNLATGSATDNWGFTDTLVSIEVVNGSEFADHVTGSTAGESFLGNGGDDVLLGGGGNDFFVGGAGNDVIDGGVITDLINYNDLNTADYTIATSGIVLNLETGQVEDGMGGVDTLSHINFVTGSRFADRITGSSGIYFEQFDGGLGDDIIDGGAINPIGFGNANRVNLFNSASAATVNLAAGTASSGLGNDTLININHAIGTRFADTLTGSDSVIPESFGGRGGNDLIDGAGGIDEVRYNFGNGPVNVNLATGVAIDGEGGTDTLLHIEGVRGSNGADQLVGGNAENDGLEFFMGMAGNDFIDGRSGYDRADYTSSTVGVQVTLGGTAAGTAADGFGSTDTLHAIEGVRGSNFNDVLTGSDTGAFESFEGRAGNDLIDGKGGIDRADYVSAVGGVVVNLATGTAADGYGSTDTLVAIENVRGSAFDDAITGDAGSNVLHGGAGNDTIGGGAGDDILAGGVGNDSLGGGDGNDQYAYEAAGNGVDTIGGFAQGDTLYVEATLSGPATSGNGSGLAAGQMQATRSSTGTTLYIGTDSVAGADIEIRFDSLIDPAQFTVIETADGHSLVGLVDAARPGRVAEIAVQFRGAQMAHADVAGNVAGKSTTNEVATGRLAELLARFTSNDQDAAGDTGSASDAFDADMLASVELVGVATGLLPMDAGALA